MTGQMEGKGTAMGEGEMMNEGQEDDRCNKRQGNGNGRGGNDERGTARQQEHRNDNAKHHRRGRGPLQ
jgi:hypothetical protein